MALANIYRVVQDLEGNVVTGVLGTVTLSGTSTLASLFSDAAGTLPLPNPTTNNAQYGSFSLFANAGTYDFQFVKSGFTFETQRNITLRDPAAGVNTITGTANRVIVSPVPGVGAVTLSTPQDIAPDSSVQFAHLGLGTPATTNALQVSGPVVLSPALPLASGGHGGTDAASARTNLGLGTMSTQNANAVAISGGSAVLTTGLDSTGAANDHFDGSTLVIDHSTHRVEINPSSGTPPGLDCVPRAYFRSNVGIQTPASSNTGLAVKYPRASQYGISVGANDSNSGGNAAVQFLNVANGDVGSITTTSSTTAYNTASDARLKRDITNLTGELPLIQALRPVRFKWNVDDSEGVGFLAQEVAALVAGVITGEPDGVREDGTIRAQMIDHSKLVPFLVGAIQTLVQRLEVVEDAVGV